MSGDLTDSAFRGYCDECGTELNYNGHTTTPRGESGSEFECPDPDCPVDEVIRR